MTPPMPRRTKAPAARAAKPAIPLASRGAVAMTGLSYLFTGISFSYLDRMYGGFGVQSLLWMVWALLGFGAGVFNLRRSPGAGRTLWVVMGFLGCVLALVPGMALYALPRLGSVTLLVIMGARACVLRTQRDLYFALTAIFVVSFMVGTHLDAEWSLWFYLGPAWALGALALAWQHAAGTALSRWIKLSMTLGFVGVSFVLASALFLFAPRPPTLGFGFLPPGTDTPGLFKWPAGEGGAQGAGAGQTGSPSGSSGWGRRGASGGAPTLAQQWKAMLGHMRSAATDPFMPRWQREAARGMLDAAQSVVDKVEAWFKPSPDGTSEGNARAAAAARGSVLWWLLVLLAAWWGWRNRYRLGLQVALAGAWLLARHLPVQSMRLSAGAMTWCLSMLRHPRQPGQSVREHWAGAPRITPLARRWQGHALELYCAMRFGGRPATRRQALQMHQAVQGATDLMLGRAPELGK